MNDKELAALKVGDIIRMNCESPRDPNLVIMHIVYNEQNTSPIQLSVAWFDKQLHLQTTTISMGSFAAFRKNNIR